MLCLGLGSPNEAINSRAQLAYMLDICDYMQMVRKLVSR